MVKVEATKGETIEEASWYLFCIVRFEVFRQTSALRIHYYFPQQLFRLLATACQSRAERHPRQQRGVTTFVSVSSTVIIAFPVLIRHFTAIWLWCLTFNDSGRKEEKEGNVSEAIAATTESVLGGGVSHCWQYIDQ